MKRRRRTRRTAERRVGTTMDRTAAKISPLRSRHGPRRQEGTGAHGEGRGGVRGAAIAVAIVVAVAVAVARITIVGTRLTTCQRPLTPLHLHTQNAREASVIGPPPAPATLVFVLLLRRRRRDAVSRLLADLDVTRHGQRTEHAWRCRHPGQHPRRHEQGWAPLQAAADGEVDQTGHTRVRQQ